MTAIRDVRIVSMDGHDGSGTPPNQPAPPVRRVRTAPLMSAILRARRKIFDLQQPSGVWSGIWSGGAAPESDLLLLFARLGMSRCEVARQVGRSLAAAQLCDGGWSRYPGGGPDVSDSVRAYLALKLAGTPVGDERLQRARKVIRRLGGADRVDALTRVLLALFGQIPRECAPRPPLAYLLGPNYVSGDAIDTPDGDRMLLRTALYLSDPARHRLDPPDQMIRELFLAEPRSWPEADGEAVRTDGRRAPGIARRVAALAAASPWCFGAVARRAQRQWRQFLSQSHGVGHTTDLCLSSVTWRALALHAMGAPPDSPELRRALAQIEELIVRQTSTLCVQPRRTPLRDTAVAVRGLLDSGAGSQAPPLRSGLAWLIEHLGATSNGTRLTDAAWALGALRRADLSSGDTPAGSLPPEIAVFGDDISPPPEQPGDEMVQAAHAVAVTERWTTEIASRQNADGGWSGQRVTGTRPTCGVRTWPWRRECASWPDVTGIVLRNVVGPAGPRWRPCCERAVRYLRSTQRADGSWDGRLGVQALWATCQCTAGLFAVGLPASDETLRRGIDWILASQQPCGGWGELPAAADDIASRGQGPPGATQTAWCVETLTAVGLKSHPSVVRGVRYLLDEQGADGTWQDHTFASAIVPESVYGQNHTDATCSAVAALSGWASAIGSLLEEAEVARQCLAESAAR